MAPSAAKQTNIRAFVQWKRPAVYAGEEIECIITFTNVATPVGLGNDARDRQTPIAKGGWRESRRASYAQSITIPSRKASASANKSPLVRSPPSQRGSPQIKGHRPALSLNVVTGPVRPGPQSAVSYHSPVASARSGKSHGRSLSIMSVGVETPIDPRSSLIGASRRPSGHGRSASLQHMPGTNLSQPSPSIGSPVTRQPSPLYETSTPPDMADSMSQPLPVRPARRRPGTRSAGNTPQMGRRPSLQKHASNDSYSGTFKFPAASSNDSIAVSALEVPKPARTPSNMHSSQTRHFSSRPVLESWTGNASNLNPITRVMSESSIDGTPRSSSEFYTMSNHSDETLTSDIPSQPFHGRRLPKSGHSRQTSRSPQTRGAEQETLMMAYAQTIGHFTLDGSLVNAAPFEEVKRRGVQGGGGVVGVEKAKRPSSMFGAFSWGTIGESLGGLLGGDEMSTMAQMKASAGTKEIPVLSTPQSLLFVDLKLGPGESRSYNYRFKLPQGLPPTYRGRAIKVSYHLSLGVQRPEGQALRQVEVPFRVLGSYDGRGQALSHDLMQPYVLLQDMAQTTSIKPELSAPDLWPQFLNDAERKKEQMPKRGLEDFLRYTERLLDSSQGTASALLSPTSPSVGALSASRQGSFADPNSSSAREAIEFAILRANHVDNGAIKQSGAQSANRFNIARSGQPVAILTLLRPAYRLGEAVTGVIDLTSPPTAAGLAAPVAVYGVLIELESSEEVDPSLALRSGASITRVTRRIHASVRENTLFARQIGFHLAIPANAAPSFATTGVSLSWRVKVEFTTQRQVQGLGIIERGGESGSWPEEELLETLSSDERGTTTIAKERLIADAFEIAVPLSIYGAAGGDLGLAETDALEL